MAAIGRTAERATVRTVSLVQTINTAEQLAPDGAEAYALYKVAAVGAMANVIANVARRA